jgi:hypothetical protein
MPSVVSTSTHPLYVGVRHHRLMGVERAPSLIPVPSKVPGRRCSFPHEGARAWSIIAERVTKMRSVLLDRRVLTPPPNQGGSAMGKVPVAGARVELVRNVDLSTAVLVVMGGARADGD